MLAIPSSSLLVVSIINTFSCTYAQFNIITLTWYDFTSYSIVLPMSISARVFQPCSTCFRCKLFQLLVKKHVIDLHN